MRACARGSLSALRFARFTAITFSPPCIKDFLSPRGRGRGPLRSSRRSSASPDGSFASARSNGKVRGIAPLGPYPSPSRFAGPSLSRKGRGILGVARHAALDHGTAGIAADPIGELGGLLDIPEGEVGALAGGKDAA